MNSKTILVIDDDPGVVELFSTMLSSEGHTVHTAANGLGGLAFMRSGPIDLVLTDFMMPRVNGMEFAQVVRGEPGWSKTKLVFMSANERREFREAGLALGAVDYLPKSLGPDVIVRRILEHLSQPPASGSDPDAVVTEPAQRLERIGLLANHLVDLIGLIPVAPGQDAEATSTALESVRQTALKIRATAQGTE